MCSLSWKRFCEIVMQGNIIFKPNITEVHKGLHFNVNIHLKVGWQSHPSVRPFLKYDVNEAQKFKD